MIEQNYLYWLEIANLSVSWALFGLIWVVQLSHYPGFKYVAKDQFLAFHQHHTKSITLIVMPLMLIELGLAILFVFKIGNLYWLSLSLVIIIWLSTFFIQIPLHNLLGKGKDLTVIQKLVNTNWIRTFLWTAKALLLSL